MSEAQSIETLVDDYQRAISDACYSDCSPMFDPGRHCKYEEADQARAALVAHYDALQARFDEHLEAWRVNNRAQGARIEELEQEVARLRELTDPGKPEQWRMRP